MVRRWVWFCVLLLLETSLSIEITNPVLYYDDLPELNNVYYEKCAPDIVCDPTAVYRIANGSCNNPAHPSWGSSITPFIRLATPVFDDGINKIRQKQKDGSILPGPREIQLKLFLYRSQDIPDICYNVNVAQFSQFLTHDISALPPTNNGPKDCCLEPFPDTIPECQTIIKLPPNDPVFGPSGRRCMNNKRLLTSDSFGCDITPRISMNQATSFIDASQVYGHTSNSSTQIRAFKDGKLLFDIINGQEFCPQQQRNGSKQCNERPNVNYCFLAGDPRANQQLGITALQTIFLRFHNLLVDILHYINPHWLDEQLYQEGRKIMGGILHMLVYRDYLPILIGSEYMEIVGLALNEYERTVYNPLLMPQLTIEFSGAIFRLPHNTIASTYNYINENNQVYNTVFLNDWMFKSDPLVERSNFDGFVRGMALSAEREPLHSYNYEISNFMFHNHLPNKRDQDLLCVDIERGRESGVPTYNTARELCGFPRANTFMELTDILSVTDAMALQSVYATPDDVDLIVGALLEPLCDDAIVGPIGRCIISDVFYRLRYADRYFVDVKDQPGSFSDEQLQALRNIDLGLIICATTGLNEVPMDLFTYLPFGMQSCEERLSNLDLSAWKDTQ